MHYSQQDILAADNAARANGWELSGLGSLRVYERDYSTVEVRYGLATGSIRHVAIARWGYGVEPIDPGDLIDILNSQEGLRR